MDDSNSSATKGEGSGAAEEPEPEPPDDARPSSTTASYDPTVFQPPHPDDRDGGNGKESGGPSKGKSKAKGGKRSPLSLDRCGNCDAEGANRRCKQCRSVVYCSPECQRVSEGSHAVRCTGSHHPLRHS